MSLETSIIIGMMSISFFYLQLSKITHNKKAFSLKMLFISISFLIMTSTLRIMSLITESGTLSTETNIINIIDRGYIISNYIFYLFVMITIISFLTTVIKYLGNLWRNK